MLFLIYKKTQPIHMWKDIDEIIMLYFIILTYHQGYIYTILRSFGPHILLILRRFQSEK